MLGPITLLMIVILAFICLCIGYVAGHGDGLRESESKHFSDGYIQGQADSVAETVRQCARLVETRDPREEPAAHIYLLKTYGLDTWTNN